MQPFFLHTHNFFSVTVGKLKELNIFGVSFFKLCKVPDATIMQVKSFRFYQPTCICPKMTLCFLCQSVPLPDVPQSGRVTVGLWVGDKINQRQETQTMWRQKE